MSKLMNVFFNDPEDHDPRLIIMSENFMDRLHMCYLVLLGKASLITKPKQEYWLKHPMVCTNCGGGMNYKSTDGNWKCAGCGTDLSTWVLLYDS